MWQSRYEKVYPGLTKAAIWAVWSDVNNWHKWDDELEYAKMATPFQKGALFELKPKGGPRVKIEITEANPMTGFTDVTTFPLARMYDTHEMHETAEGLKLVSVIRVEGALSFLWRKIVAEGVARGAAKQMDALVNVARSK